MHKGVSFVFRTRADAGLLQFSDRFDGGLDPTRTGRISIQDRFSQKYATMAWRAASPTHRKKRKSRHRCGRIAVTE